MRLKWAQQPFRRPNWKDWRQLYEKVMRNRRIILLVQLQLRKTLEVAEMPLYSFPHFFSVVLHFFFLFFPFFIIFFFSPLQRLLCCPLLYFVLLFILFFPRLFCFSPFTFWQKMFAKEDGHARWSGSRDGRRGKNRRWTRRWLCEKLGEMLLNGNCWLPSQFTNNTKHLKSLRCSVPLALSFAGLFSDHCCFGQLTVSAVVLPWHPSSSFHNQKRNNKNLSKLQFCTRNPWFFLPFSAWLD